MKITEMKDGTVENTDSRPPPPTLLHGLPHGVPYGPLLWSTKISLKVKRNKKTTQPSPVTIFSWLPPVIRPIPFLPRLKGRTILNVMSGVREWGKTNKIMRGKRQEKTLM